MNLLTYLWSIKVSLSKFNSTLVNIDKDMGEQGNDFKNLEADLAISRSVNTKIRDRIISLECQCWSNSLYSRLECLEITGLPDSINNEDLEETALMIFETLEVTVDSSNVEDCHWLPGNQNKRFIIKLSKHKNLIPNKIQRVKKKLKGMNLSSIGITTPVYINDSLCSYFKILW